MFEKKFQVFRDTALIINFKLNCFIIMFKNKLAVFRDTALIINFKLNYFYHVICWFIVLLI
ncbi:hypothetical protein NUSPORA_00532 [Nucleospora cyclopteri]